MLQGIDERVWLLGGQDPGGVGIHGEANGRPAMASGLMDRAKDDLLMSQVNAVEDPRAHGASWDGERTLKSIKNLHRAMADLYLIENS